MLISTPRCPPAFPQESHTREARRISCLGEATQTYTLKVAGATKHTQAAPNTFAQHPAQGELLFGDEHILQFVLQFVTDAQAVHCWGRGWGEKGTGPLWFLIPDPACLLHLTPPTEQTRALPQLE